MPTPHYSTGITFSTAVNKAVFTGVILTFPKTTTKVTYLVSTADNTANVYDIGIYSGTPGGTHPTGPCWADGRYVVQSDHVHLEDIELDWRLSDKLSRAGITWRIRRAAAVAARPWVETVQE